jgi:hypothetical protein
MFNRYANAFYLAVLTAWLAGCASSSNGSATIDGTILGQVMTVQSSLSYTTKTATAGSTTVVLGSWADGCALGPHVGRMKSRALVFSFAGAAGAGPSVSSPGSFTVAATSAPGSVTVVFVGNDASCVVTSAATGASGTVQVTAVSGSQLDGNFDVVLTSGEHISGSFSAPACAADDVTETSDDGGSTCE